MAFGFRVKIGPGLRGLLRHVLDKLLHPPEIALDAAVLRETGEVHLELAGLGPLHLFQQALRVGGRELTGISPRIDRFFPSSTSKRYLKG